MFSSTVPLILLFIAAETHAFYYYCGFDSEVNPTCGWNLELSNSDRPWVLKYGPAPRNPRTGPPSDRSGIGKYVFAQSSTASRAGLSPLGRGTRFRMSSPSLTTTDQQLVLRFYYFMWGKHVGVLNAFVVSKGERRSPKPVWRRTGSQEEMWLMGEIRLPLRTTVKVIFEMVSGRGVFGDVAIDDVTVEDLVVDCTFEEEEPPMGCNFTQHNGDNFDWQLNSGKTPTRRTGPAKDHTLATNKGTYMYLEATGPNANDQAALMTPVYIKDAGVSCNLSFFYHMSGEDIGTLKTYVKTSTSDDADFGTLLWQRRGEQRRTWLEGRVNLTDVGGSYQIVFLGTRGGGTFGDIALDDVKLLGQGCLNQAYRDLGRPSFGPEDCYTEQSATDYRGFVNMTRSGLSCQSWTAQSPHEHTRTPENYPDAGLGDHNYCRNPDNEDTAWCYTQDTTVRWEYCNIGTPQETCVNETTNLVCSSNPCLNGGQCVPLNITTTRSPTTVVTNRAATASRGIATTAASGVEATTNIRVATTTDNPATTTTVTDSNNNPATSINPTSTMATTAIATNGSAVTSPTRRRLMSFGRQQIRRYSESEQVTMTTVVMNADDEPKLYMCMCGPGWTGDNCEQECVDQHRRCSYWAGIRECEKNPNYMLVYCKYSCAVCIDYVCEDRHESCAAWAEMGECDRNPYYMKANCHKSCGMCLDDECFTHPCLNGATCIDGNSSYTCQCPDGFEGVNCEIDTDECGSAPCANNGTCTDVVNGYYCNCTEEYEGDNCEHRVDQCSKFPCLNGATCTVTDTALGYNCSCPYGFDGDRCEIDIDECLQSPCQNEGTCIDQPGGFVCNCSEAFTGPTCEHDFNECLSNPCQHGGSCFHGYKQAFYFCQCEAGWEGDDCERETDECASNPCQNGAACTDVFNGFNCTCAPGYNGLMCETDINECVSSPCENGGECIDRVNGYTCLCEEGLEGPHCEIDINECQSGPCVNGGTCVDQRNGHICECGPDFSGRYCEIRITTPPPTTTTTSPPTTTSRTTTPEYTTDSDWIPSEFSESSYVPEYSYDSFFEETTTEPPATTTPGPIAVKSTTAPPQQPETSEITTTTTQMATTTSSTTATTREATTRTTTTVATTTVPSTAINRDVTRASQKVTENNNILPGTDILQTTSGNHVFPPNRHIKKEQKAEGKIIILATVLGGLLLIVIVCVLLVIAVRMRKNRGVTNYHQFNMDGANRPLSNISMASSGWHELKSRSSFGDTYDRLDDDDDDGVF